MAKSDDYYRTRRFPVHIKRDSAKEKPFVVAFENSGGYGSGTRITLEQFYDLLETYESVIVHFQEEQHPSEPDRYLLYGEARSIDLGEDDIGEVTKRKKGKELTGRFRWFHHGQKIPVDLSIGLHCLDEKTWQELP